MQSFVDTGLGQGASKALVFSVDWARQYRSQSFRCDIHVLHRPRGKKLHTVHRMTYAVCGERRRMVVELPRLPRTIEQLPSDGCGHSYCHRCL